MILNKTKKLEEVYEIGGYPAEKEYVDLGVRERWLRFAYSNRNIFNVITHNYIHVYPPLSKD